LSHPQPTPTRMTEKMDPRMRRRFFVAKIGAPVNSTWCGGPVRSAVSPAQSLALDKRPLRFPRPSKRPPAGQGNLRRFRGAQHPAPPNWLGTRPLQARGLVFGLRCASPEVARAAQRQHCRPAPGAPAATLALPKPQFQLRTATGWHRRHGGVSGGSKVGVKGFSRRRRCERRKHP